MLRLRHCALGSLLPFARPVIFVARTNVGADRDHFGNVCAAIVAVTRSAECLVAKGLVGFEETVDSYWRDAENVSVLFDLRTPVKEESG